ncbi:MAG: di-trans,poly-cis-decaprenylcistransferase [Candidatus Lokiarchaeota archaeon]|nr:di-trans,poly-cis-decaprenylcistransferase [Candidatus Lokiarchaeota archaeon]
MVSKLIELGKISNQKLPRHVGIIPDGNRRWAKLNNLKTEIGHLNGYKSLKKILYNFFDAGIQYLTVYTLSLENALNRPKDELKYIYKIIIKAIDTIIKEKDTVKNKVRFRVIGRIELLPDEVKEKVNELHKFTENFNKNFVNLLIMYDGQAEITDAIKKIVEEKINPEEINRNLVKNYLYTPDFPEVDLIIRTGMNDGARISGFLLWDASYSEFKFRNEYWPEYNEDLLYEDLQEYVQRNRRKGK